MQTGQRVTANKAPFCEMRPDSDATKVFSQDVVSCVLLLLFLLLLLLMLLLLLLLLLLMLAKSLRNPHLEFLG